jgi:hypothetical protein
MHALWNISRADGAGWWSGSPSWPDASPARTAIVVAAYVVVLVATLAPCICSLQRMRDTGPCHQQRDDAGLCATQHAPAEPASPAVPLQHVCHHGLCHIAPGRPPTVLGILLVLMVLVPAPGRVRNALGSPPPAPPPRRTLHACFPLLTRGCAWQQTAVVPHRLCRPGWCTP